MEVIFRCFAVYVIFAAFSFFADSVVAQEQYQTEISAEFYRTDVDTGSRLTAYGASAEVFFIPVKTEGHPYAEAAFLEHVGSVYLGGLNTDIKSGTEGAGRAHAVGINFTEPALPVVITAAYRSSHMGYDPPANMEQVSRGYSFSIGNYLDRAVLAGIEYYQAAYDLQSGGMTLATTMTRDYGLFVKYVVQLPGENAWSLEGRLLSRERQSTGKSALWNTRVFVSAAYFFDRTLSAGAGLENNSGDDKYAEGISCEVNIRSFITPRLSVQVSYDRFLNANAGYPNQKRFGLALAARF